MSRYHCRGVADGEDYHFHAICVNHFDATLQEMKTTYDNGES